MVATGNATRSYVAAGYTSDLKSAAVGAHKLLQQPKVQRALEERRAEALSMASEEECWPPRPVPVFTEGVVQVVRMFLTTTTPIMLSGHGMAANIMADSSAEALNDAHARTLAGEQDAKLTLRGTKVPLNERHAAIINARAVETFKLRGDYDALERYCFSEVQLKAQSAKQRPTGNSTLQVIRREHMNATVKIHQGDKTSAMSTNAMDEPAFMAAAVETLEELIITTQSGGAQAVHDALEVFMPQVVDICCKLRGYKANVTEHRIIVAGEWVPDDVVAAFPSRASAPEKRKTA
jgi:hypothetical protein